LLKTAFNKRERKNKNRLIFAKIPDMKIWALILLFIFYHSLFAIDTNAQCSICTKTAQQLGEKPAKGMNSGILYLAFAPFAIVGYIGFRWWKNKKE
jgi:hypothetical protein